MLAYYFRSVKEETLQTGGGLRPGTWVHVEDPAPSELDELAQSCGLNRDLLQDAVDFYEVPRYEYDEGVVYFFARFPCATDEASTAPILIAVSPTAVITVARTHPDSFDSLLSGSTAVCTTQRTKLFLLLVGALNAGYRTKLVHIRRDVQRSRVHLRRIRTSDIVRLVGLESTLNDFISALLPMHAALRATLASKHLTLFDDDRDVIEDVELENQQLTEAAKANLTTIQNIRSAYTAIMTNDLNAVMKLLTSLTIILIIPTIVGAFYGMNVPLPWSDSPHVFAGIVTTTLLLMAGAWYLFSRKNWL